MESSPQTHEYNIEKGRRAFVEAISDTKVNLIDFDFENKSMETFIAQLQEAPIFLLGEVHGVKENIDVIYTLVKKFGFRNIALEWDQNLQSVLEEYLMSGEIAFPLIMDSCDGRVTAGHFALIKKLNEEGVLDNVVCFDQQAPDRRTNSRDKNMAEMILGRKSGGRILVIAGNLHAKTQPIVLNNSVFRPMGEFIKETQNVIAGEIKYLSGEYENIGVKTFSKKSSASSRARFYTEKDGRYVFELPEVNPAVVPKNLAV